MKATRFLCLLVGGILSLVLFAGIARGTGKFGTCGMKFGPTRLRTACQVAQDANIGWYRGTVRWNEIMDDEGNLNFQSLDRQMKITLNKNIEIILTLRSVHEFFAPDSGKLDLGYKTVWQAAPPTSGYLDYYEAFVREIVERYDGDGFSDAPFTTSRKNIKYWQIEFEPGADPDRGSNFWNGTAESYAYHYLVAYDVIKEADPDANVALAAFTWGAMHYYRKHGVSFPMEVLSILAAQGGDFDIFDFHFYKDYDRFLKINSTIRTHLKAFPQFSAKPVWVTETNVDRKQLDPYLTVEKYNSFVAKDIVRRSCVFLGRDIQKVFWFNLSDKLKATWNTPMRLKDFERFTGLTDKNFSPKPVYYTYKLLSDKINGKKNVRRLRSVEPDDYTWIYKFGLNDHAVYVLWYDNPDIESNEVLVPLPWDQVLITHVVTEPGITEPQMEVRPTSNGALQIILDDSPVFVEKYRSQDCDLCDLNQDSVCNAGDLSLFGDSYGWGQFDCNAPEVSCMCDLNHDGSCNDLDGVLFLEAYERADCRA